MQKTDLAAYVASRILHDVSSPLTAVMAGFESALDPGVDEMTRKMSAELVSEGIEKMFAQVQFLRFTIGSQELNDNACNINELKQRANEFARLRERRTIDWAVDTQNITNRQARLFMNMALLVIESVAKDGAMKAVAREDAGQLVLECIASGSEKGLRPTIVGALEGTQPDEGWGGGRIQPFFVRQIADELGFTVQAGATSDGAGLVARGPLASLT